MSVAPAVRVLYNLDNVHIVGTDVLNKKDKKMVEQGTEPWA